MTDHTTNTTAHDVSPPSHLPPQRAARHSSAFERGPSSSLQNSFINVSTPDSNPAPLHEELDPLAKSSMRLDSRNPIEKRRSLNASRGHKHRPSGAFLLNDPLFNPHTRERDAHINPRADRQYRKSTDQYRLRNAQHDQTRPYPRTLSGSSGPSMLTGEYEPTGSGHSDPISASSTLTRRERDSLAGDTAVGSSPRTSITQMDLESAQIVNMALNLSESRRLASRRSITQPAPPRLVPLPDGTTGGSLRHHLQQQRRISQTISPKPDRSPRIGPGRVLSPLQPAFEPEGGYRYHFSQSTLARAQKAKEYLDLMAQYRRVLELLPPLEVPRTTKGLIASPPSTSTDSIQMSRTSTNESETRIGRPYNPLQYIRNRKVRARERKAIDGEGQGFNDVPRVSEWIDEVAKWVATGQAQIPGNPALPPFSGAQAASFQSSPPSNVSRSTTSAAKPKRPRVDWAIDPADMIADVYWLELDDNKRLVEDRHWKRVFPQGTDAARPLPLRDEAPRLTTPGSTKDSSDSGEKPQPEAPPPKHEHEHVLSTARDRAQQKLRALKGSHHRQNSSVNNRDFLRIRRASVSESSDTDSDRRRRARAGTATTTVRSVLEKQMEEMIAREQRESESSPALYDHEALRMKFASLNPATPERDLLNNAASDATQTKPLSRGTDSRADLSESECRLTGLHHRPSPPVPGRASLEVPSRGRRFSVDYDTSQPNSPDLRPNRDVGLVPAIGMDLSPLSSRPSSPSRNPLSKVKSIFRERSKERITDNYASAEEPETPAPLNEKLFVSPEPDWSAVSSPERRPSRSPIGRIVTKGTDSSHRSHKSVGSVKLKPEDVGGGFRSLFRGPRIDTVLRSGVSKISDMVWRKDAGDDQYSTTSSSDSEAEARGRSRGPRVFRRGHGRTPSTQNGKHQVEPLPQFVSVANTAKPPNSEQQTGLLPHPPAQPLSRRSSRFDLLKPPRIDIQDASPSASPPPLLERRKEQVESDVKSRKSADWGIDRTDMAPLPFHKPRQFSTVSSSRHWSIADRGGSTPTRPAISKREIARLKALILSSGIHAMEVDRRAKERKLLTSPHSSHISSHSPDGQPDFAWKDVISLCPDPETRHRLVTRPVAQIDLYPLAARTLSSAMEATAAHFQFTHDKFARETAPHLEKKVEATRWKIAGELTDLAHRAADEADEANHDMVAGQRLKVKRVVDHIEKMLRRRRRRFRWLRRAGWLGVEWVLVGFMWWVWFMVMISRVVIGLGRGGWRLVRWLLWLE
ncbi:uncharacterized protein PODANS_1_1560 [Podospora anserina S mat+]|uniref:Podospora anserina S mat+ genomic DNA chromosome 1, supercontig 1 n=1 Tax=Podospora anserina (strain S / ATCC MYA-4624 / DSM 980 / FGSC 10383) TaxID=515849 RepID=B2A9R7_PODAN|nr:uncharacterized protein PODANS_1_1560 [Podospora anserina S mat+]CAP59827.1 unnamed protein product [Podospora anserina S mat+]CDP22470.1 Putative protein of unknown function [Podospora anserina S mat+]